MWKSSRKVKFHEIFYKFYTRYNPKTFHPFQKSHQLTYFKRGFFRIFKHKMLIITWNDICENIHKWMRRQHKLTSYSFNGFFILSAHSNSIFKLKRRKEEKVFQAFVSYVLINIYDNDIKTKEEEMQRRQEKLWALLYKLQWTL